MIRSANSNGYGSCTTKIARTIWTTHRQSAQRCKSRSVREMEQKRIKASTGETTSRRMVLKLLLGLSPNHDQTPIDKIQMAVAMSKSLSGGTDSHIRRLALGQAGLRATSTASKTIASIKIAPRAPTVARNGMEASSKHDNANNMLWILALIGARSIAGVAAEI